MVSTLWFDQAGATRLKVMNAAAHMVLKRACLDHDQCVRLGHSIASVWCNDHLADATWDAINANDCSGVNFDVDYDMTGTNYEGNCPTNWKNANDGCDHGCQFVDGDCFR